MLWTDPYVPLITQLARSAAFIPAADVVAGDGDLVLTMDLPGLAPEDLTIEVQDDYLTVRGERPQPEVPEGGALVHAERPFGAFERVIGVPEGVDADGVTATMDRGVLTLVVPKPEQMKPRTISIGAGSEQRELETATA
jgi:HSP20 family protein